MHETSGAMDAGARAQGVRCLRWFAMLAAATLLGLLAACSNGGGGSSPPTTVITQQPTDTQVTAGASATFTVQASSSGQYQWQRRAAGASDWQDIPGATGPQYTTTATAAANSGDAYRVVVTWTGGATHTSSIVTLTVQPEAAAPAISVQPADATVVAGQDASFSVTATGTSITYRWQTSTDGTTWTYQDPVVATLTLHTQSAADDGTLVRVLVSNSLGSVASAVAHLHVQAAPAAPQFSSMPANVSVVAGQSATFEAQAFGTPAPDIAWQVSTNSGGTWTAIPGATSGSYTIAATTLQDGGKLFRAVATNASGTATSAIASLVVQPAPAAPVITITPASTTVAVGNTAGFSVFASGTPTPTYQWQVSADGGVTFANINGATQYFYNVSGATLAQDGWRFRVVATNSLGSVTSAAATLSVMAMPSFTIAPLPTVWQPGVTSAYFFAATAGSGTTLQWRTSPDACSAQPAWTDVPGATGTTFQLSNVADANIRCVQAVATNGAGSVWSFGADVRTTWWKPVNGMLTSAHLTNVRWTSATTAIAVGDLGTVLRTTDGGATWSITAQLLASNPLALAVHGQTAISLSYGWIVLRSIDAGVHWFYGNSASLAGSPRAVAFSGAVATAVGDGGVVARSSDGGATWTAATTDGSTANLLGVAFNAAGTGIAVGDATSVLRSTDGGATWSSVAAQGPLRDVAFVDATTAVAVGYGGKVLRSTDAGLTWHAVSSGSTIDLVHVAFDGAGHGSAVPAAWGPGAFLHTADGGLTWTLAGGSFSAESVAYAPVATGAPAIAVGPSGSVETSSDGGATWTLQGYHPTQTLRSIAFGSTGTGLAVGDQGMIQRSTDGGNSWAPLTMSPTTSNLWDVAFVTAQVAVAVGDGDAIWRSTDAGATWNLAYSDSALSTFVSVHFTSATHGVAVGSAAIVYTDDAGLTWHPAATGGAPKVQAVSFGSALVGVAVGDGIPPGSFGFAPGAIMRTTDGGLTWSAIALAGSFDMTSVAFADANTVVAVGPNGEIRSTDGGQTWATVPSYPYWSVVRFTSATEGLNIALTSFLGRSHDAGLTWPDGEYVVGDALDAVVIAPNGKTFVVTAGGGIYRNDAP